ncbi:MAG: tetratricopeptide repeat protein [Prolixibacteraceae bacterium]|nr:tetratricopeptide repeat protein [Prolixibacteraceae bacterium]
MKRYFLHTIFLFLLVSVIGGCSTEKNTTASRAFHNITSHYNVYFNANESFKSGVQEIEERIENDFTRVLPIYKSSDPSTASMVKSDMENAVIKSSKLIEIHSITKKPSRRKRRTRRYQEFASQEEFNKWVDDAYLLMGKAYFYQKNYFAAVDNFSYVVRKYPDEETKDEANIWLIRSYSEMERFTEASEVIQAIQNEENFSSKLERELAIETADYYLKQNLYTEAIKFLDIAIGKTVLKKNKTRFQYIIAQLYQELGMDENASAAYREVLKLNPDYNMAFNAKISAAGVFAGTGDKDKMLKELNKMLRDKKNIDFRDQIYYAIANIFFREGNRDQAIDNYAKSVAASFQNQFQRALSAITLADIYLEQLQYRKSQAYYDSAMIIVDENYPNYQALQNRYKSLTSLVDQLMIVEREDSLQMVANMPDAQREALISQLIKDEQERQRNQANLALQEGGQNSSYYRANRNRMGMGNQQTGAGWYFYNPQTVSYGRVTFQQVWGQRKLEDNWRRSNKASVTIDEFEELEEAVDSSELIVMVDDPLQKEFYTQYLPLTDSMMQISHTKIRDALYNSGKIFKSEFNNYERSAESFENLNSRYPDNIYLLSSYFDLYDLYELMGDNENSNKYRNLIISQFPDSKYAQYLQNPNFFIEMEARTDSINQLYQEAFRNYKGGYYRGVITLAQQIKSMQPDSQMIPKIDFMAMVANGTQTNVHEFENLLEGYVSTYPNEEPTPLAKEILKLIQDSTLADYQKLVEMGYISEEIQNEELLAENLLADDEFGGKYTYDDDLLHYFVVAYPRDAKVDINRLKFDIANYNIDHYTKIDFDIETDNLDENTTFLLVRALENKETALIYHGAIIRKATVFQALKDVDYYNFVISSTNYREIMAERSINDYLKFFVKNYSRFIESNFIEDENEISPEELMARAKAEDEVLQERGEFVVVNTGAEKFFNLNIDTLQNFVIAVKDKNLSLRQILNEFSEFNSNEYRIWNLALQLKQTDEYQLLVVNGIPTLNESMSYFRKVVVTRSLFDPLGQSTYRNFLITNENLQKMIDENRVDDYMDFFRTNYIQSAGSQESSSNSNTTTAPTAPVTSPLPQTVPANSETVQEEKSTEEYTGPYNLGIETEQYFVFVIPTLGIDQPAFVNGIEQFNRANYASLDLKVEVQPLDDIRQIVLISGLPDREAAQPYFTKVVNNRDLYTPLRDGNYRNFLVTKVNYEIFLKEKNINDYMDFYRRFYLNQ